MGRSEPTSPAARLGRLVQEQRVAFAARYGAPPSAVVSAPGRINVIGEHTDYNHGLALPGAIDRWIVVTLTPRHDDLMQVHSEAFEETVVGRLQDPAAAADGWSALPRGAARLFGELYGTRLGFDALIGGNLPRGAGVSSSAAVEMALLGALRAAFEAEVDDLQLVLLAQRVEHECLGVATGLMDQYSSQFGRPDALMLVDFAATTHEYIDVPLDGWAWLLLDTKVRHELAESAYGERVAETRRAFDAVAAADASVVSCRDVRLRHLAAIDDEVPRARLHHYVLENQRVQDAVRAIAAGDAAVLGELMSASHASLRDEYAVSCVELDVLQDAAVGSSACAGARMMGGGFGGCTLNLVRAAAADGFVADVAPGFKRRFGYSPGAGIYQLVGGARVH